MESSKSEFYYPGNKNEALAKRDSDSSNGLADIGEFDRLFYGADPLESSIPLPDTALLNDMSTRIYGNVTIEGLYNTSIPILISES